MKLEVNSETPQRKRDRPVPLIILRGHTTPLTSLSFLTSSSVTNDENSLTPLLASADEIGTVRIWDIRYEECVTTLRSNENTTKLNDANVDPIISLVFHSSSDTLFIQHKSGRLNSMNLQNQESIAGKSSSTPTIGQSFCRMVCVSTAPLLLAAPAGNMSGSSGGDSTFALIDPRSDSQCAGTIGETKFRISSYKPLKKKSFGMLLSLCSVPSSFSIGSDHVTDGDNMIAGGFEGGAVAIWDIRSPSQPFTSSSISTSASASASTSTPSSASAVLSLTCHPKGNVFLAAGASPRISAYGLFDQPRQMHPIAKAFVSPKACDNVNEQTNIEMHTDGVSHMRWTDDGRSILVAGWDGKVHILDGRRNRNRLLQPVTDLKWHDGSVTCLDYAQYSDIDSLPSSSLIASGGKDTTIALWDAYFS